MAVSLDTTPRIAVFDHYCMSSMTQLRANAPAFHPSSSSHRAALSASACHSRHSVFGSSNPNKTTWHSSDHGTDNPFPPPMLVLTSIATMCTCDSTTTATTLSSFASMSTTTPLTHRARRRQRQGERRRYETFCKDILEIDKEEQVVHDASKNRTKLKTKSKTNTTKASARLRQTPPPQRSAASSETASTHCPRTAYATVTTAALSAASSSSSTTTKRAMDHGGRQDDFPPLSAAMQQSAPLTTTRPIHEIWTQAERILNVVSVDSEHVQPASDRNNAVMMTMSEQSLQDLTKTLGLTMLSSRRSKSGSASKSTTTTTSESENDTVDDAVVNDDDTSNSRPLQEHPMPWRRPNIAKLRDKLLDSLDHRLARLQAQQEEAAAVAAADTQVATNTIDLAASSVEAASAQDCDHDETWEYVTTSCPLTHESLPKLDECYQDSDRPLYYAIEQNDEAAISVLLRDNVDVDSSAAIGDSPLQLAVSRNRPKIVRLLLRSRVVSSFPDGPTYLPSTHLAVQRGHDECLQLLLSHNVNSGLIKDEFNNNLLHACCTRNVPVSTLQLVLYMLSNSAPAILSKAMLSTNIRGETPLHVACRHGLTAHVEVFLSSLGFALLSKLFQIQDAQEQTPFLAAVASGSTNVVMSMFMWRGNNQIRLSSSSKPSHCPLACAVKTRNVDMVMLLLEFNDPCGRGYDLTGALHACLLDCDIIGDDEEDDGTIAELCRVLVLAGANPCDPNGTSNESAILLAMKRRSQLALAALIDTYDSHLQNVRMSRRKDPALQKQPDSFFAGMDSRESMERLSALRDALVAAIYFFYTEQAIDLEAAFACIEVLFRRGAKLDPLGLLRLRHSISTRNLQRDFTPSVSVTQQYTYNVEHPDALTLSHDVNWSKCMLNMPWTCKAGVLGSSCLFAKGKHSRGNSPRPNVVIVSEEGERFFAHGAILAERSEKLGAAIRFDQMSKTPMESMLEIQVDISSELCLLFLEHIYHGSMLSIGDWKTEDHPSSIASVHKLLDLLVIADEYLLPTLTQECAMRLLSSDPKQCFCRSCTKQPYDNSISTFQVRGPATCINVKTCLDILAVIQHLRQLGSATSFSASSSLSVSWEETSLWGPASKHEMRVDALDAISEAVNRYILMNFNEVMQQHNNIDDGSNSDGMEEAHQVLLLSLDEYVTSPIGADGRANGRTNLTRPPTTDDKATSSPADGTMT